MLFGTLFSTLKVLVNDGRNGSPVGNCAQQDEDVPNGMIMRPFIVGVEVGSGGIEQTLGQD